MCKEGCVKTRRGLTLLIAAHFASTIVFYVLWNAYCLPEAIILPRINSLLLGLGVIVAGAETISNFTLAVSIASFLLMPLAAIVTAFVSIFGKAKLPYLIVCVTDFVIRIYMMLAVGSVPYLWQDFVELVLSIAMVAVMFMLYFRLKKGAQVGSAGCEGTCLGEDALH